MSRRPVSSTVLLLLTVLAVLAAFVFQVRADALGGLLPASAPATSYASHMAGMDMGLQGLPSSTPDEHAGHGAHCPFCPANAFALEADAGRAPGGPLLLALPDVRPTPRIGERPASHTDARAPPRFL